MILFVVQMGEGEALVFESVDDFVQNFWVFKVNFMVNSFFGRWRAIFLFGLIICEHIFVIIILVVK